MAFKIDINALNNLSKDSLDVLFSILFSSNERKKVAAKLATIEQNQTMPVIPIGYSGGGQVLLDNVANSYVNTYGGVTPKYFDVKTAILVGAPVLRGWINPMSKLERIINIYSPDDQLNPLFLNKSPVSQLAGKNVQVVNIELQGGIGHTDYFYDPTNSGNIKDITYYSDAFIARTAVAAEDEGRWNLFKRDLPKPDSDGLIRVNPSTFLGLDLNELKRKKGVATS